MSASPDSAWVPAAEAVLADEPLFASKAPHRLDGGQNRPRAVYMGVGLCTRHRMAAGLPIDILGMLLPADALRRAVGAEHLVVLVADAHAASNGFPASEVEHRARAVTTALNRIKLARELDHLRVVRASFLQAEAGYQAVLARIRARAGEEGNEYMYRQTADVAFLDQALGGILKLGWTVGAGGYRDEVAFDGQVAPWSGHHPGFAYVRCARAFDDRRPKVSPYVGVERGRRLYLDPAESIDRKLARAGQLASARNVAAAREHLDLVAQAWGATGAHLDARLNGILANLYPGRTVPAVPLRPPSRVPSSARGLAVASPVVREQ